MKRLIFLIFLTVCVSLYALNLMAAPALYSMKDLEILSKENNYLEFLEHARDIRPHARDKNWKEMLNLMAEGYTMKQNGQKDFSNKTFSKIEGLLEYPGLVNNDSFITKRNDYARGYLDNCFRKTNKSKCRDFAMKVFLKTPTNYQDRLGLQLGELLAKNNIDYDTQWFFFKGSTVSAFSEFYCKSKFLKQGLFKKLTSELKAVPENKIKDKIYTLANSECINELVPELKTVLFKGTNTKKETAYLILKETKQIDKKIEDLFLTIYILEGPNTGTTFNNAWSRLTALGQDYVARSVIMEKLKKMDPLPDNLFSQFDTEKRVTIINHLSQNFPEYLTHYAKTCIEYLEGKNPLKFPAGNPTTNCFYLFKNAKGKKWLSKNLINKFGKVTI